MSHFSCLALAALVCAQPSWGSVGAPPRAVVDASRSQLEAGCQKAGKDCDVRYLGGWRQSGGAPVAANNEMLATKGALDVSATDGTHSWTLRFSVDHLITAWSVNKTVAKGEALSCADLLQVKVASRQSSGVLTEAVCPLPQHGYQSARFLQAGHVLKPGDIRTPPAIQELSSVDLRVTQGGIQLTVSGVALADGDVGQLVPVKLAIGDGPAKIVKGQVAGPGLALLER